jgi:GntR family transcriptional regulator, transcriptional repressor for pyruvate dehydrogenase complex
MGNSVKENPEAVSRPFSSRNGSQPPRKDSYAQAGRVGCRITLFPNWELAQVAAVVLCLWLYHHTLVPYREQFIALTEQTRQPPVDMRYSNQTTTGLPAGFAPRCGGGNALYKLVRTSRLYEQIVQQIEESILKGTLKAGDQLPAERDLAQRFGVSRTAVREAVKALREKGLVEAYSGRGTFITDGTSQAVRQSFDLMVKIGQPEGSTDLAEVRSILEPEIAALAAERASEADRATLREAVAVMDRALKDADAYIEADLDFHLALAEAAANPLILSLIDSIVGLLREQRLRIFQVEGGPQRGQVHHKRILEAMEKRDPKMAREAMKAHLEQVREDSEASARKSAPAKQPRQE